MSREHFEIVFDGDDVADHKIDAQDLGPALMGLGDAVRKANARINGDRATVRVLVESGFEHGCFQVNLEMVQHVVAIIKDLIQSDNVKSAKDILEWLGIIGGAAISALRFMTIRDGRDIESTTISQDENREGVVTVKFVGDNNSITVNQNVYKIATDPNVATAVRQFVSPLDQPGISEIRGNARATPPVEITKVEANQITKSCDAAIDQSGEGETNIVTANLVVKSPTFDADAEKWRFLYGGKVIIVDISETSIAEDVMARGSINVNDTYRVQLEIKERKTPTGQYRHHYKIIKVLGFRQVSRQRDFFEEHQDSADNRDEGEEPNLA